MKVEKAKRLAKVSDLKQTHAAAVRHLALKNRMLNPDGRFDNAGRFFLSTTKATAALGSDLHQEIILIHKWSMVAAQFM